MQYADQCRIKVLVCIPVTFYFTLRSLKLEVVSIKEVHAGISDILKEELKWEKTILIQLQ